MALISLFAAAAVAAAPAPVAPAPPYGAPITLEQIRPIVEAAEAEARRRGVAVTIAVAEPSGVVVFMERMTGASYASTETAPNKARSAAMWMRPTASWLDGINKGTAMNTLTFADLVASNGGEPIVVGGRIIGGIGVGGSGPNEAAIAAAALAAAR